MPPAAKKKVEKSKKDKGKAADAPPELSEEELMAEKLRSDGIIVTFAASNKLMHRNQRDIAVESLTMTFHGTPLLEDTSLT